MSPSALLLTMIVIITGAVGFRAIVSEMFFVCEAEAADSVVT